MNHRIGRIIFSLAVGFLVASISYRWITDTASGEARAREERVVRVSRSLLEPFIAADRLAIVDPLAPNRKVGKVYVFAKGTGWEVSGYYRRDELDSWHPYLMTLSGDLELLQLKIQDAALAGMAAQYPALEIRP